MDGGRPEFTQRTTTGSNTCPPTPKLKDSCDLCSASKVRCNKQKPACGRCDKLGYPCFYSQARRGGRPYRPRNAQNQLDGAATESPSRQRRTINPSEYTSVGLQPSSREPHISARQEEEPADERYPKSDYGFNIDAVLRKVRGSRMSQNGQVDCQRSDRDLFKGPIPDAGQKTPNTLFDNSNSNRTTSNAFENPFRISTPSCGEKMSSNASETDCMTVAMDMLQQLDMMSAKLQCGAGAGSQVVAQNIETAIHTITTTFRHLSTILICPCSERSDVGLLAAAVCVTILDVYGIIISNSPRHKEHPSPTLSEDAAQWDRMDLCTKCYQDRPEEEVATMRVLGELPKVAKVVLQFTKRYRDRETDESSPDPLPAMTTFLKCRLQSITNEATDRLV